MLIEKEETNTGLLLGRDLRWLTRPTGEKIGKKVSRSLANRYSKNIQMLELVRAKGIWTNERQGINEYIVTLPILSRERTVEAIERGKARKAEEGENASKNCPPPFTPPRWKEAQSRLKAFYYQAGIEALAESEGKISFCLTYNLTPEFTRKALSNGGIEFIRRRMMQELRRALGHNPPLWLTLEATTEDKTKSVGGRKPEKLGINLHRGRPHIHGSILFFREEIPKVKKALRIANGPATNVFKRHELDLRPLDKRRGGGLGWADYITKHPGITRLFIPHFRLITRTNDVATQAQPIYEAHRQAIIAANQQAPYTH